MKQKLKPGPLPTDSAGMAVTISKSSVQPKMGTRTLEPIFVTQGSCTERGWGAAAQHCTIVTMQFGGG